MNNIFNKKISKKTIENLVNEYSNSEVQSEIKIKNIKKFQKAFTHKSYSLIDSDQSDSDSYCCSYSKQKDNNEVLEFLGDKVIDLIVTEFLFDTFPEKGEGFLTKLKSRIVKKESLASIGEALGFKKYLLISSHIERIGGRENPRFMEDVFESFMGSLYKDQGSDLNICKRFLLGIIEKHVDLQELIENNDNYKDILLRYFHIKKWGHPVYHCSNEGLGKPMNFTCIVKNPDDPLKNLGSGTGKTKKIAEQLCAKKCLENLNVSKNF